jgi:hypothetical protein
MRSTKHSKFLYVVRTKTGRERKAAANLSRSGHETRVPLYLKREDAGRLREIVVTALVPGHVFIECVPGTDLCEILATPYVTDVLRQGGRDGAPAAIPEEELDPLRNPTGAPPRFVIGSKVKIIKGNGKLRHRIVPLKAIEGPLGIVVVRGLREGGQRTDLRIPLAHLQPVTSAPSKTRRR